MKAETFGIRAIGSVRWSERCMVSRLDLVGDITDIFAVLIRMIQFDG